MDSVPIESLISIPDNQKDHTLLLAGDIGYPWHLNYRNFLKDSCAAFEYVVFILGNHEYYTSERYTMEEVQSMAKGLADELKLENLHYLQNQSFCCQKDIVVLGTTLWSPISKQNEHLIKHSINDYRCISFPTREETIRCKDINALYETNKVWLKQQLEKHKDTKTIIVLTHHLPSLTTLIAPQYKGQVMNEAFGSDLEPWMNLYQNLKIWVCGHTHMSFRVTIGHTECIVNPRGYKHPSLAKHENERYDPRCLFEVL